MIADPKNMHRLIRSLGNEDLERIIEIERSSYPYPWTEGIFEDCIRVGYECVGLQLGPTLIGYVIQSLAAGESHLLNLCIAPDWQAQGYGTMLLNHAIRQATLNKCNCMFLEVRPSNPEGLALYQRKGFSVVGQRPGYYRCDGGREDAIVMKLIIHSAD
jgi:ribosomal-protein-alanine N-acetyltransferase